MSLRKGILPKLSALLALSAVKWASADYILSPISDGQSERTVNRGQSFDLDLVLSTDGADVHDSAIFRVIFFEPGLRLESYLWAAPYETGTIWDDSDPFLSDLPLTLNAATHDDPSDPPEGIVDIELSNVVPPPEGDFGAGTLVSLSIAVPVNFAAQTVFIGVIPDTLANGFSEIPTTAGAVFQLHVVPEPSTAIAVFAFSALLARRRR